MKTHWLDLDTAKLYINKEDAKDAWRKGHRIAAFNSNFKWVLSWVPISNQNKKERKIKNEKIK